VSRRPPANASEGESLQSSALALRPLLLSDNRELRPPVLLRYDEPTIGPNGSFQFVLGEGRNSRAAEVRTAERQRSERQSGRGQNSRATEVRTTERQRSERQSGRGQNSRAAEVRTAERQRSEQQSGRGRNSRAAEVRTAERQRSEQQNGRGKRGAGSTKYVASSVTYWRGSS